MCKCFSPIFLGALLALGYVANAGDGPKVIAAGEWSKPVADHRGYAIRGRLVLCEKVIAEDRREVAVYVELQDACDFIGESMRIFCDLGKHDFRPEYKGGLQYELRDKDKQVKAGEPFAFSGGTPKSQWITLPTDGTIRLRATPFGIHRPGALVICPDLGNLWIIQDDDPGEYFLSGTFTVEPAKDQIPEGDGHVWRGTLELPPMKIVSRGTAAKRS